MKATSAEAARPKLSKVLCMLLISWYTFFIRAGISAGVDTQRREDLSLGGCHSNQGEALYNGWAWRRTMKFAAAR